MPRFTGGSGQRSPHFSARSSTTLSTISRTILGASTVGWKRFRDVLVPDTTVVTLYQSLTDSFPGSGDKHAGAKLHVVESVSTDLPTQFSITDVRTHESIQLSTGKWLSGSLLLYDQGFFDYRTMNLIDTNDG